MEWKGIKGVVLKDVSMKRYTSMKVGGPVKYLFYPSDEADLKSGVAALKDRGVPYRFLGNGTNLIVSDAGVNEALIRLTRIHQTRYKRVGQGVTVDVSGGASLKRFIKENGIRGLSGLEHLYWIPGTVGGAVKMNAGSFGSSIADHLQTIRLLSEDGSLRTAQKDEKTFGYRKSPVKTSECVVGASFLLKDGEKAEIRKEMEYVVSQRKEKHPMDFPSAGSIFKGVQGEPAWKFIDRAGLRGYRIGGAAVSEKHPNFIINLGWATGEDIKMLVDHVKREVFGKLGVRLAEEVEFWGFDE
jgi:UDP-N-acetylmuramate dehydrogenase